MSIWTGTVRYLQLTDRQRSAVSETFLDRELPPLYVKLIFDMLVKWTSYSQASNIPTDIISSLAQLFTNLESTHGMPMYQRVYFF